MQHAPASPSMESPSRDQVSGLFYIVALGGILVLIVAACGVALVAVAPGLLRIMRGRFQIRALADRPARGATAIRHPEFVAVPADAASPDAGKLVAALCHDGEEAGEGSTRRAARARKRTRHGAGASLAGDERADGDRPEQPCVTCGDRFPDG